MVGVTSIPSNSLASSSSILDSYGADVSGTGISETVSFSGTGSHGDLISPTGFLCDSSITDVQSNDTLLSNALFDGASSSVVSQLRSKGDSGGGSGAYSFAID